MICEDDGRGGKVMVGMGMGMGMGMVIVMMMMMVMVMVLCNTHHPVQYEWI